MGKVSFTDENNFNLDGPDGQFFYFYDLQKEEVILSCWRADVESVMFWSGIIYQGTVDLIVLTVCQKYIQLLKNEIP